MSPEDRRLYLECRKVKLGEADPAQDPFARIASILSAEFQVNLLKISYLPSQTISSPRHSSSYVERPKFRVVVETRKELKSILGSKNEPRFLGRSALLRLYHDVLLDRPELNLPSVDDRIYVDVNAFSSWAICDAVEQFVAHDREAVIEEFRSDRLTAIFTDRTNLHVFFTEDTDVPMNEVSGASYAIATRCRQLIARYDEFGYTRTEPLTIYFSSQETIARNGGNTMYLLR